MQRFVSGPFGYLNMVATHFCIMQAAKAQVFKMNWKDATVNLKTKQTTESKIFLSQNITTEKLNN